MGTVHSFESQMLRRAAGDAHAQFSPVGALVVSAAWFGLLDDCGTAEGSPRSLVGAVNQLLDLARRRDVTVAQQRVALDGALSAVRLLASVRGIDGLVDALAPARETLRVAVSR